MIFWLSIFVVIALLFRRHQKNQQLNRNNTPKNVAAIYELLWCILNCSVYMLLYWFDVSTPNLKILSIKSNINCNKKKKFLIFCFVFSLTIEKLCVDIFSCSALRLHTSFCFHLQTFNILIYSTISAHKTYAYIKLSQAFLQPLPNNTFYHTNCYII